MTVREYHREVVDRLDAVLGERLVGVYASGSFALDDFDAVRSDLDLFAVSSGIVTADEKHTIVARIRDETPCPGRGLEFVLYPEATARVPSDEAGFLLNLNTARGWTCAWELDHLDDRELVATALDNRHRNPRLGRDRVERFVDGVLAELWSAEPMS